MQVTFTLQNAPFQPLELPSLRLTPLETESGTVEYDLSLIMEGETDNLAGFIIYNTDLFDAATIEQMVQRFQRLLEAFISDPDQHILDGPLLT